MYATQEALTKEEDTLLAIKKGLADVKSGTMMRRKALRQVLGRIPGNEAPAAVPPSKPMEPKEQNKKNKKEKKKKGKGKGKEEEKQQVEQEPVPESEFTRVLFFIPSCFVNGVLPNVDAAMAWHICAVRFNCCPGRSPYKGGGGRYPRVP